MASPSLQVSISGQFQKGDNQNIQKFGASSLGVETTGKNVTRFTRPLSAGENVIPLGSVGTIGFVYIKCNDAALSVRAGAVTGQLPIEVGPLQHSFTGWNGAAVIVAPVSGTPDVEVVIIEK